jgi:CelD/BcsL family acetyltransferase involved in cellulose biosynthesis
MIAGDFLTKEPIGAGVSAGLDQRVRLQLRHGGDVPSAVLDSGKGNLANESAQGDGELVFKAHQGPCGLEALAPEWSALAAQLPGMRFMHLPEWYRAYLTSRKSDPELIWFVAAYRRQLLVAIFPLQFQSYRVKSLRPRLLGTIDDGELQLSDFVFAQTEENRCLLHDLTRWLRVQRLLAWDELRLRKVPEDSAIAFAARACPPLATLTLRHDGSAYFDTSDSYEHATQAMSGTFKRNLRRLTRRAEETAPLRHQSYRTTAELATAFEAFIEIEASGWKGSAGTASAIRCQAAMLTFYRELVTEFAPRGACVVNLLWHGDEAVAGQFCLQIGRTLSVLKIGFSNAHSHFAPGNLLLDRMIRQACEDTGVDVLSLVNEPPWARNFKPLLTGLWSYNAPNWSVRGVLVHLGLLFKRQRDKWAHKPNALVERAEDA